MSTGQRPFGGEGKTLATTFNDITQKNPPEPSITEALIPRELSAIIMKALEKEPANRFQTGNEVAQALKESLVGNEQIIATTTAVPDKEQKAEHQHSRRRSNAAGCRSLAGFIFYIGAKLLSLIRGQFIKPEIVSPVPQPSLPVALPSQDRSAVRQKSKSPPVCHQHSHVKKSPGKERRWQVAMGENEKSGKPNTLYAT